MLESEFDIITLDFFSKLLHGCFLLSFARCLYHWKKRRHRFFPLVAYAIMQYIVIIRAAKKVVSFTLLRQKIFFANLASRMNGRIFID